MPQEEIAARFLSGPAFASALGRTHSQLHFKRGLVMKPAFFALVVLLGAATAPPLPRPAQHVQAFKGNISDSACGLKHMMSGSSPQKCTLECINMGAKFVLADEVHQKVYALSDQAKARPFAGENVVVKGTLSGVTINVESITAAK
jgi:hypothetical protein